VISALLSTGAGLWANKFAPAATPGARLSAIFTPGNMDKKLLDIICCPVTQQPLQLLDTTQLEQLNAAIGAGTARNTAGSVVAEQLIEALVTRDGRIAYPLRDGIPVLLESESIDLRQLTDDACA